MDSVATPMPTEETPKPFAAGMYNHQPINKTRVAIAVLAGVAFLLLLSTVYFAAQYMMASSSKSSSSNSSSSSSSAASVGQLTTTSSSSSADNCNGTYTKASFANLAFNYDSCKYNVVETAITENVAGVENFSLDVTSKSNGDKLNLLAVTATSGTISGNSAIACSSDSYKIITQGTQYNSSSSTNNDQPSSMVYYNKGLIEIKYRNPAHVEQYIFSNSYQHIVNFDYFNDDTATSETIADGYCLMSSHPIYVVQDVEGTSDMLPDQNNIFYIIHPTANSDISTRSLADFEDIVSTIQLSLN